MTTHLLSPHLSRGLPRTGAAGSLPFAGGAGLSLACGRVHEFCGPARRTLALAVAGAGVTRPGTAPGPGGSKGAREPLVAPSGPVLWIQPDWVAERLYPAGFAAFCDPGRLVFVTCLRAEDLLWSAEEALRSGAVSLVVADLPSPPALTPVRRLHLAAEAGGAQTGVPPLGLLLTPGPGGAQGVESRWHMAPRHDARTSRWRLERRRARGAAPGDWTLEQGVSSLHVVD